MNRLLLSLGLALLTACAANDRLTRAEQTLKLYGQQIRWSQFAGAATLLAPEQAASTDPEILKHVKVVSYLPIGREDGEDGATVVNTVRIGYYDNRTARQREMTDRQLWRYDAKARRWRLETGLPTFP